MFTSSELRILDANANRAREALRVLEDYARFALNHDGLSGELKQLRHDLAAALRDVLGEAILHRDTPGDVGTDNKTAAEGVREDLAAVVTAAGKRLAEALRVMEEVGKTEGNGDAASYKLAASPFRSAEIERIRYRFYELEQQIARTLRPGSFENVRLYVLVTESICRRPWLEVAAEAIAGGADCLQLREKAMEGGELLARAKALVALCRSKGVLCIVNDRADIAVLADADGVHLGQEDLPAAEARKLLGTRKIIGVSTHRIEQARRAVVDGADYIGVGPIFASSTKPRDFVAGLEYARQVAGEIRLPAVAIAGISSGNVDQVLATGIRAVAVTAAVAGCEDVRGAAAGLKRKLTSR